MNAPGRVETYPGSWETTYGCDSQSFAHALSASLAAVVFCGFLNSAAAEPITLRVHTFTRQKRSPFACS